jgi:hypothetical protein
MNHNQRNFCICAVVLSGCTAASTAGKAPAKAAPKPPPRKISLTGPAGGTATLPDPKLPGKYIWTMSYHSLYGLGGDSGYALGRLTGVTAFLYQHGVLSAVMTAPTASGDNKSQVIVATGPGRVFVKSKIEPGTTLEADKMTWNARTNKILAVGNVVYHNGKSGLIMHMPRLNADTVLKSGSFAAGHADLP